jgi:methyl-accepting chemotaxis protein
MADVSAILTQQTAASKEISDGIQHVASQAADNVKAIDLSSGALDSVEKQVSHLLELMSADNSPERTLLMAKVDHVMWRRKLIDMLAGRGDLVAEGAADETTCRLGRWMHGPAAQLYTDKAAFRDMQEPHRVVHQAGLAAIRAHKENRILEAEQLFAQMDQASVQVLACLDRLVAGAA